MDKNDAPFLDREAAAIAETLEGEATGKGRSENHQRHGSWENARGGKGEICTSSRFQTAIFTGVGGRVGG